MQKILCGGITVLGFWVYCDRNELKEARCLNLLSGMLSKAKKYIKGSSQLIIMPIFSGNKENPEIWIKNDVNLSKTKENIKPWIGIKNLVEIEAKLPVSIVYPLPKIGKSDIMFKEITKKIIEEFENCIEKLKCTINGNLVNAEERLDISKVIISIKIGWQSSFLRTESRIIY